MGTEQEEGTVRVPEERHPDRSVAAGVVAMGASAGGLDALQAVLGSIPRDFPWPIVIAQHMSPDHVSQFATILQRSTPLPVHEAKEGETLRSGVVYVCPAHAEMSITHERALRFRHVPSGRPQRIDHLFSSAAAVFEDKTIAVVLSGTGTDGSQGALAAKRRGGVVVAESEESARHFAMPNSAIQAGAVDHIRPAASIGPLLKEIVQGTAEAEAFHEPLEDIQEIFTLLQKKRGTTFDEYRSPTLRRRIRKRMQALGVTSIAAYIDLLKARPEELDLLFDTLLINVTDFFRNPPTWDALGPVIEELATRARRGEEVRIWCAGCASGEEPYSIGILLSEAIGTLPENLPNVRIFATDIDQGALAEARAGIYDATRLVNVSAERLQRFFSPLGNKYEVSRAIRRLIIFGVHDLTRDPPIGRIDLLVCRNVFIYFDLPLQRRILTNFHYALRAGGHLFLGRSEGLPRETQGFDVVDSSARLYVRPPAPAHIVPVVPLHDRVSEFEQDAIQEATHEGEKGSHLLLAAEYITEAGSLLVVVLDEKLDILFSNRYADTIFKGPGIRLVGQSLHDVVQSSGRELAEGVTRAIATSRRVHIEGLRIQPRGKQVTLDVTVESFRDGQGRPRALILAQDITSADDARRALIERAHELQETIEELQTANEELQSTNEEIVTANEELQSSNEELATLNEELQSTNEELGALNAELQRTSLEVSHLDRLLEGVASVTREAIIVTDERDIIIRWGRRAVSLFSLSAEEAVGRNIFAVDLQVETGILRELIQRANNKDGPATSEPIRMQRHKGSERWIRLTTSSSRNAAGTQEGTILVFEDVTSAMEGERALGAATARYHALLRGTKEGVLVVNAQGRVLEATPTAKHILGPELVVGSMHLWDVVKDRPTTLQLKGALADLIRHSPETATEGAHSIPVTLKDGRTIGIEFVGVESPGDPPLVIVTEAPH